MDMCLCLLFMRPNGTLQLCECLQLCRCLHALKEHTQPVICSWLSKPLLTVVLLYMSYAEQSASFADNNGGYGYGGQNNNSEFCLILCMSFIWGCQACVQNPCLRMTLKACCLEA